MITPPARAESLRTSIALARSSLLLSMESVTRPSPASNAICRPESLVRDLSFVRSPAHETYDCDGDVTYEEEWLRVQYPVRRENASSQSYKL
jgi:hypothetical protein